MANWTTLKESIANIIRANGNQEITGAVLQNTLCNIVNSVGKNATFAGIATPTTNPGMQDGPVFYFTVTPGVYPNFNGLEVENQGLSILYCEDENWKSLSVYVLAEGDGNVIVTPIREDGEKIAVINGISIYAPKSTVDVEQILIEGTPIATVAGVTLYAPESGGSSGGGAASVDVEQVLTDGTLIAKINGVNIFAPKASAGASAWAELTGKPAWLTDTAPSVSAFTNDVGYITLTSLTPYAKTADLGSLAYKSSVTYNELAASAVMTSKIADGAVTNAKIATPYMTLWGQKVTLGGMHDGSVYLGANMGIRFTDGTKYAWIKYDSTNNALYVEDNDGNAVNFYATGGLAGYGHSGIGQGGGGTVDVEQILTSGTPIATVAGITLYAPAADTSRCVASLSTSGKNIAYNDKNGNVLGLVTAPYAQYTDQLGATGSTGTVNIYGEVKMENGSLAVAGNVNANYNISAGGNLSAAGSLSVTGESRFSGAVYLPGQYTFFGQSGIYVEADRTTKPYGTAAYIGVHRSFSGVGTIAAVTLDGRVRIWQPMGINQDPEDGISLRVGGTLKTDLLTAGGMTRPEGYWFASPNGYFGNPTSGTYTSFGDGGIELSQATPYIDFHYGCSTADYTSRLIASEDGVLKIDSATADPALRIGNAYLRYDAINNALYVTGQNGAQVHLYATGGIAAYSGLGSGITQLANLSLTGQLTAASVKANNVGSDGILHLNAGSESSIILNKNTTVDSDGWITTPQLNATQRIVVNSGGEIRIGSTVAEYRITDVHADGTYVYITINGKRYRLTPSSTTTV